MIGCIVFILGAALQTGTNGYAMMVTGRAIAGLGIGTLSMIVPLYISELGKSLNTFYYIIILILWLQHSSQGNSWSSYLLATIDDYCRHYACFLGQCWH